MPQYEVPITHDTVTRLQTYIESLRSGGHAEGLRMLVHDLVGLEAVHQQPQLGWIRDLGQLARISEQEVITKRLS